MIDSIFCKVYNLRQHVLSLANNKFIGTRQYEKYEFILFIIFFAFEYITIKSGVSYFLYIGIALGIIFIVFDYIEALYHSINSARGLFKILGINFLAAIMIAALLGILAKNLSNYIGIVFLITYFILWLFICISVNLEASKMVNKIISLIISFFTALINIVFLLIPSYYNFDMPIQDINSLKEIGYTPIQIFHAGINIILFYFIFVNIATIITIDAYTYWENKYVKSSEKQAILQNSDKIPK